MINNILSATYTVMGTILTKRPAHCTFISLPLEMVRYLDSIRNPDISRSRFLFRLIQRVMELEESEINKNNRLGLSAGKQSKPNLVVDCITLYKAY